MNAKIIGVLAIVLASPAVAQTDFGVRTVAALHTPVEPTTLPLATFSLAQAAAVGARFGTVTSMRRSVEHNRQVGGVRNSYHLSGRAIDIVRRRGVKHWQLDQAMREAGLSLVESIDEGDHSHFAFQAHQPAKFSPVKKAMFASSSTNWGIVLAPRK